LTSFTTLCYCFIIILFSFNVKYIFTAVRTLCTLEENIQKSKYNIEMIKHSSHQKSSEVRNIEARVVDHHTNVSVLQDFVEDVPRLASKEMDSDLKILINAVADDSSQLVHSDRKIYFNTR